MKNSQKNGYLLIYERGLIKYFQLLIKIKIKIYDGVNIKISLLFVCFLFR